VPWLQPFPDARFADPASQVVQHGSLRLVLIAAMQVLPPRQRAVLILRDVLEFSAPEVAALLDTSPAAVNSALQRARAGLSGATLTESQVAEPDDSAVRDIVDRYIGAFEAADVDTLVTLLTDDAVLEMPPVPLWYLGKVDYGRFIARVFAMRGGDWRMIPTSANAQPAVAAYCRGDDDAYHLHPAGVHRDGRGDRPQCRVPGPAGVHGVRAPRGPRRVDAGNRRLNPPAATSPGAMPAAAAQHLSAYLAHATLTAQIGSAPTSPR
jgi:RNA polymerase sigma-70 factor (ECF subfamily)